MNQADVKVSSYLKKSEADAKGYCPVMARLNVGKYSEAAFSVKMSVPHTMWHSGRATGKNRVAGSLRAYKYAYMHVEKFLNEKYKLTDIPFTALDCSFIEKYDLHLRTDCHLALSSIVNLTTSFRTIVNEAVADGILTFNPFWGYEPERPQWKQKYLTAEELELMMTTPLHNARLYIIRDLFLFSCYTGISYGDMCLLTERFRPALYF